VYRPKFHSINEDSTLDQETNRGKQCIILYGSCGWDHKNECKVQENLKLRSLKSDFTVTN
jgi:hypothetical protein